MGEMCGRLTCPVCEGAKMVVIGTKPSMGMPVADRVQCPFCKGRGAFTSDTPQGKAVIAYWGTLHLEREAELQRQFSAERRKQELRRAIFDKLTEEELAEVASWSKPQ